MPAVICISLAVTVVVLVRRALQRRTLRLQQQQAARLYAAQQQQVQLGPSVMVQSSSNVAQLAPTHALYAVPLGLSGELPRGSVLVQPGASVGPSVSLQGPAPGLQAPVTSASAPPLPPTYEELYSA